ncbi:MAG: Uma2 family endonuclease [Planctomycetota bacterium]
MSTVVPESTLTASETGLAAVELTAADLAERVGDIPLFRIRKHPPPGAATENDVEQEDLVCELIEGVLVQKGVSFETATIGMKIGGLLLAWLGDRKDFIVCGADGLFWLDTGLGRVPDVAVVRRADIPGGVIPSDGYLRMAPTVAVEVISPSNRPGEMRTKREHYLSKGTELVWIIDPKREVIEVYVRDGGQQSLRRGDTLTGEPVLPGFIASVDRILDAAK